MAARTTVRRALNETTKNEQPAKSQITKCQQTSTNDIYTTNVFGEITDDLSGTKFGANGNVPIGDNKDVYDTYPAE